MDSGVLVSRLIRSYPPEYRRWILEQLAVSTESLVAFSAHSGIPVSTLSTWRSRERRQRASPSIPSPAALANENARAAPDDSRTCELEHEVASLRAKVKQQRIDFTHQALELAEALVENFCLRSGLNPTEFRVSRVPAAPDTNQESQR